MAIELFETSLYTAGHCTGCLSQESPPKMFEIVTRQGRNTQFLALCRSCLESLHTQIIKELNLPDREDAEIDLDNVDLLAGDDDEEETYLVPMEDSE